MMQLVETKPPQCVNTGAVKWNPCAGQYEDDQPDTIEMMEAGVHRQQRPRMDWCE